MKIWFVEDDRTQREIVEAELRSEWPEAIITWRSSENGFYDLLASVPAVDVPDVVVCDVRLPWSDRAAEAPAGFRNYRLAGVRCSRKLLATPCMSRVPVVLYTVFGDEDLDFEANGVPSHVGFLTKVAGASNLIAAIRRMVGE